MCKVLKRILIQTIYILIISSLIISALAHVRKVVVEAKVTRLRSQSEGQRSRSTRQKSERSEVNVTKVKFEGQGHK